MTQPGRRKFIDISVTLKSGMVHWPSDPAVNIKLLKDMKKGAKCNMSLLSMGSHTGTHMDSPRHFLRKGKGLDRMPLDVTIGPARVISIKDRESIKPGELEKYKIKKGERILFKTVNSSRCWKTKTFKKRFVYISKEAARYLAEIKVRMVGIDYLSVGVYGKDSTEIHEALLKSGIWLIEGLDLSRARPGRYQLICLPLKILNADGAPARAVLLKNFNL